MPESTLAALEYLDGISRIYWPPAGGVPRLKRYLDEARGGSVSEIITDIPPLSAKSKEKLGYPTQKPLALLERIISVSSNPGDLVMDPFCGCGTAVAAAEMLDRNWIGIDMSHPAIALIEKRLNDSFKFKYSQDHDKVEHARGTEPPRHCEPFYQVEGTPRDYQSAADLARRDKFQFQYWACSLVDSHPMDSSMRKGPDKGIDGVLYFTDDPDVTAKKVVVSVKGGDKVGVSMIRDLDGVMARENAAAGLFITLRKPTRDMVDEALGAGMYTSPDGSAVQRIQILTIQDLLDGKKPDIPKDIALGALGFKRSKPSARTTKGNRLF